MAAAFSNPSIEVLPSLPGLISVRFLGELNERSAPMLILLLPADREADIRADFDVYRRMTMEQQLAALEALRWAKTYSGRFFPESMVVEQGPRTSPSQQALLF